MYNNTVIRVRDVKNSSSGGRRRWRGEVWIEGMIAPSHCEWSFELAFSLYF